MSCIARIACVQNSHGHNSTKLMHKPYYRHAGWLNYILRTNELSRTVELAAPVLERYHFDALAFRGMSGALIAPILAVKLQKSLIMVRKHISDSHSGHLTEGDSAAKTYIIVDDFIASGETIRRIIVEVKDFAPEAECLGALEVNYINDPKQSYQTPYFIERCENDLTLIEPSWMRQQTGCRGRT